MSTTVQRVGLGILGFAMLLGLWQLAASSPTAQRSLPGVGETAVQVVSLLGQGSVWANVGITLGVAVIGLVVGTLGGVLLGLLIGLSATAMHATRFVLEFLKPIPAIVILPLVVLVLGPTSETAIFLVFFTCVLPTAAQTAAGVHSADPVALDTARSFGMSRPEIIWRIVLPSASPYIGTAVRMCAPVTLIIVVIAGLLGGAPGLGRELALAQMTGRFTDLIAYVLMLGVLGVLVQGGSEAVERRALHWHTSFRAETHA